MPPGECTYWDQPAGEDTGRLFLMFGWPVCADRISNCPLDRVLAYKNFIYLLNLHFGMEISQGFGHAVSWYDLDLNFDFGRRYLELKNLVWAICRNRKV